MKLPDQSRHKNRTMCPTGQEGRKVSSVKVGVKSEHRNGDDQVGLIHGPYRVAKFAHCLFRSPLSTSAPGEWPGGGLSLASSRRALVWSHSLLHEGRRSGGKFLKRVFIINGSRARKLICM